MSIYRYRQNNTGGSFIGPVNIDVEASSPGEADEKALTLGIYFDGIDKGLDCDCCGDRWYRASEYSIETEPPELGISAVWVQVYHDDQGQPSPWWQDVEGNQHAMVVEG